MTETPLSRLRDDLRTAARPGGPDSRPVGHVRVLASDLEALLGMTCRDEGCPHFGTPHAHSTLDEIALDAATDKMDVQYPGSQREQAAEAIRAYLAALPPKLPASEPSPADDDRVIVFDYRNHRGQKGRRRVAGPLTVWHGTTKWHPLPQWFLGGHCLDQDAHRDFALADCRFTPETPLTHLRESQSVPDNVAIIVLPDGSIFYVGPIKQVPSEHIIPHGSVVNLSPKDFASVQRRMKAETPIATIEH